MDDLKPGQLIVVIAKGTQGFGRINYAKTRSTLYYRGKAKIFFAPEYVLTNDGRCIEVRVNDYGRNNAALGIKGNPENNKLFPPENIKNCKYLLQNVTRPPKAVTNTKKGKKGGEPIDADEGKPDREKAQKSEEESASKSKNENRKFYYDQCVAGKRPQITFGKGVVGAVAATGLALVKDNVKKVV